MPPADAGAVEPIVVAEYDYTGEAPETSEPDDDTPVLFAEKEQLGQTPERHLAAIEHRQETTREFLALATVSLLSVVVLWGPIALALGQRISDIKELLEVLLPPILTLAGSVTGFYFAGRQSELRVGGGSRSRS